MRLQELSTWPFREFGKWRGGGLHRVHFSEPVRSGGSRKGRPLLERRQARSPGSGGVAGPEAGDGLDHDGAGPGATAA